MAAAIHMAMIDLALALPAQSTNCMCDGTDMGYVVKPLGQEESPTCPALDTRQDTTQRAGSWVHLALRQYQDRVEDLSVKIAGGKIGVERLYHAYAGRFEHEKDHLRFHWDALGEEIISIDKGGVTYIHKAPDSPVCVNDTFEISREPSGYLWKTKYGKWKSFDENGRPVAFGSTNGVAGMYLYHAGADGKATGIADRANEQVIWFEYDAGGRLATVRDVSGRTVTYGYDSGRIESVRDVRGYVTHYEYDARGRLSKKTDPAGSSTSIGYSSDGSVAQVLDDQGNGQFFHFGHDSQNEERYAWIETTSGRLKEVWLDGEGDTKRVALNGTVVKTIEKQGRILLITDELGNITRKDLDEKKNVLKITYPDNSTVSYEYDPVYSQVTRETNERGAVTRNEYDDHGNLARKTEALGAPVERVTEYTYDEQGNMLTAKRLGDANTAEALTVNEYDDQGNLTTTTDPESHTTRFTHDVMGSVLTKTDPLQKTWTFGYDNAGHLTAAADPLGNVTQFVYDEVGNRITQIDAENKTATYTYDSHSRLAHMTDALGHATLFRYSSDGEIIARVDAEGKTVQYEYDMRGRLAKVVDGNGNEIALQYAGALGCSTCSASPDKPSRIIYPTFTREIRYDSRGRKTEEKDILTEALSHSSTYGYDEAGNLTSVRDKEEKVTTYQYDELNRLTRVTDPLDGHTTFAYDNRDNQVSLTDANNHVHRFDYDRNNQVVTETRPMGQETSYAYDDAGRPATRIDAKSQKRELIHDDAGRLTGIDYYANSSDTSPARSVALSYDNVGKLTGYDDGVTQGTYGYDDLHRKTSERVNYGSFELSGTTEWYANGTKKSFTGPDGVTYDYTYDDNKQPASISIPGQGFVTFDSYRWTQPNSITLPGGTVKSFSHDPLMRLKRLDVKAPTGASLMQYAYSHDRMDNILAKATEHGPYTYGYDDLYRLTQAEPPAGQVEGFTYDPVGNRLTASGITGDWSYNGNNELQSYEGVSFKLDQNGNTTRKTAGSQSTVYLYDEENRLTRVETDSGGLIGSYQYDPFGRRLWKEVGGTRTHFLYSDEGLVGEYNATGTEIKTYGYKPGSTWSTDPVFMKQDGEYYFYHNDHLGTPMIITDVDSTIVWSARYSSFGETTVDPGSTVANNLRFAGQYYDAETGLHYNWFRYYDPKSGRYVTSDPIGLYGDINLYAFTSNDPVNVVDPLGLFSCNPDGSIDPHGIPKTPGEGAAAWAQYQKEKDNQHYTYASNSCGGKDTWKCNCFVRDALQQGGGLKPNQLPKHHINGKKQWSFATANELADLNLNTDVLGIGDGSIGNLVAWANNSGSGHTGIVGCNGKIYSAGAFEIYCWNSTAWFSYAQIVRYIFTGRDKMYRSVLVP